MEDLVPVINKLYDVVTCTGSSKLELNLPQIVVIGSQSAGKSSVLESLVGRGFLPRGSGIVTRRPLVLQLVRTSGSEKEYAEFNHRPRVRFTDFDEVRKEIERETDRITGANKGISRVPIGLKVYSSRVLDLTLVDLPGITRVPVGDQPPDIEQQIRAMCLEYITPSNAIILAVTPGNVDISTSDAIQLARSVDPQGNRTLGVITKLDLMDRGTDAYDLLTGKHIPLRLGYVGVVCRGQKDIENKTGVDDALKKEHQFFVSHPRYSAIAEQCGTQYLSKRLNQVFLSHIRSQLPSLKARVNEMLKDARATAAKYKSQLVDDSPAAMSALLLQLLTQFASEFSQSLSGSLKDMPGRVLFGGAKIRGVFEHDFADSITSLDPFLDLPPEKIRLMIRNASGTRTSLFIPESAFEALAKQQVQRLEQPSLECLDKVYDEILRLLSQLENKVFAQYRNVREAVAESAAQLVSSLKEPTGQMIHNLIRIELSHINTSHPDFIGGDRAIAMTTEKIMQKKQRAGQVPSSPSSNPFDGDRPELANAMAAGVQQDPDFEIELVRTLLVSYFDVVRKNILDSVPKAIMFFLVARTEEKLHNHLVQRLYMVDKLESLLEESPEIRDRRATAKHNLETLEKASAILNEIRASSF